MKTIVINTSVEAKNTGLDVLFKVPFDPNNFLWFDVALAELSEFAGKVKQSLINETFTVDRDYNLIVLVDLCDFPHSQNKDYLPVYKALMSRYISKTLVSKLHNKYEVAPMGVLVYFMDAAKKRSGVDASEFYKNAQLEEEERQKQLLQNELNESKKAKSDKSGNDVSQTIGYNDYIVEYENDEEMIMEIFSWDKNEMSENLDAKMRISASSDLTVDFFEVFETELSSYYNGYKIDGVIKELVVSIINAIEKKAGKWDYIAEIEVPDTRGIDCKMFAVSCVVNHENEQSKLEGYFNVFANVFNCVQNELIVPGFRTYENKEIAKMLAKALKKYRYVLSEKKITVNKEPIGKMLKLKDMIFKRRSELETDSVGEDNFWGKESKEIADIIMNDRSGASEDNTVAEHRFLFGIDKLFYKTVGEIFGNYDDALIQSQNNRLVKNCLTYLWKWRDRQTVNKFKEIVDGIISEDITDDVKTADVVVEENNVELALHADDRENEYSEIINEITETEHKLLGNNDVLLDTENLLIKYSDVMRKCRTYWVSTIGAILSVSAVVLPFIYVQHYSTTETIVHKGMYAGYLVLFIALYLVATAIYMTKLASKKKALYKELAELKEESERDRKESIMALHRFYTKTVVKAENHFLFWQEIDRRQRENARKGNMMNSHKLKLEMLIQYVENFMTKLKYSVDIDAEISEKALKKLCICGEETFYSENNKRIYSFLSNEDENITETDDENDGEGENE